MRRISTLVSEPPQRAVRWPLQIAVAFRVEDTRVEGETINVSASGLLATFPRPLEVWTEGTLEMLAGDYYLDLHARVARVEQRQAGLSFLLETPNDRRAVELLLEFAAGLTASA